MSAVGLGGVANTKTKTQDGVNVSWVPIQSVTLNPKPQNLPVCSPSYGISAPIYYISCSLNS